MSNQMWNEKAYTNSEIKIGNPLNTKDETPKVVFIEEDDPNMEREIQKIYKERFPELAQINNDIEIIQQKCTIKTDNNEQVINRRILKVKPKGGKEDTFKKLVKIKTNG